MPARFKRGQSKILDSRRATGAKRKSVSHLVTSFRGLEDFCAIAIAVTDASETIHQAIHGAAEKLKRSLDHLFGRLSNH
jgi:hypothetical protein